MNSCWSFTWVQVYLFCLADNSWKSIKINNLWPLFSLAKLWKKKTKKSKVEKCWIIESECYVMDNWVKLDVSVIYSDVYCITILYCLSMVAAAAAAVTLAEQAFIDLDIIESKITHTHSGTYREYFECGQNVLQIRLSNGCVT